MGLPQGLPRGRKDPSPLAARPHRPPSWLASLALLPARHHPPAPAPHVRHVGHVHRRTGGRPRQAGGRLPVVDGAPQAGDLPGRRVPGWVVANGAHTRRVSQRVLKAGLERAWRWAAVVGVGLRRRRAPPRATCRAWVSDRLASVGATLTNIRVLALGSESRGRVGWMVCCRLAPQRRPGRRPAPPPQIPAPSCSPAPNGVGQQHGQTVVSVGDVGAGRVLQGGHDVGERGQARVDGGRLGRRRAGTARLFQALAAGQVHQG